MKKKLLLFIFLALPCFNLIANDEITHITEEDAIRIGRALAQERFPGVFFNRELSTRAMEINEVWKIEIMDAERSGVTEDGKFWTLKGGVVYIEISKVTGALLRIWVDD